MSAPATILLVDDEIQNLRLLEVLLRPEGYVTRTANSGEDALASVADDPPDLILLDDMMPGMHGVAVTYALKSDPATRGIPIIMVTAQTDRGARLAALNAGTEDFLTKPVDRAELSLRVRNLLRLKELSDLLESRKSTLEAEVQERTAELQVSNNAIRSFAVVAHELRTPLSSITGFSALLTENWDNFSEENRQKFVTSIDRQSQNMTKLVDGLLTSQSMEDGGLPTSPKPTAVRDAIDRCLKLGDGDTARVAVSCSPDLIVLVDPNHLARILGNYLQNALKYGEPPVRIEATQVGDIVAIRVLDHGPGVSPEFVHRLFDKYARADIAATRAHRGTGLGLSIVRGLAEANDGLARYEPNLPNGSCFIAELPAGGLSPSGTQR
jgi:signal transduction histidine kinase